MKAFGPRPEIFLCKMSFGKNVWRAALQHSRGALNFALCLSTEEPPVLTMTSLWVSHWGWIRFIFLPQLIKWCATLSEQPLIIFAGWLGQSCGFPVLFHYKGRSSQGCFPLTQVSLRGIFEEMLCCSSEWRKGNHPAKVRLWRQRWRRRSEEGNRRTR